MTVITIQTKRWSWVTYSCFIFSVLNKQNRLGKQNQRVWIKMQLSKLSQHCGWQARCHSSTNQSCFILL